MPSQFIVKPNEAGGFDVFMRDMVSHGEYSARYTHMISHCGYSETEAALELYHMVAAFIRKTTTDRVPFELCEKYVFDFCSPGDIIQINWHYFVVNRPASA